MSKPFSRPNLLLNALVEAMGFSGRRVTAIEVKARAGGFPVATVEMFVPDENAEAVAAAMREFRPQVEVLEPKDA